MVTFGEYLKITRKSYGYSQEHLASKLNVSKAIVSCWEANKYLPKPEHMSLLLSIFQPHYDALVSLYFSKPMQNYSSQKKLNDMAYSLMEKAKELKERKSASLTPEETAVLNSRFFDERELFQNHVVVLIDFVSHLKEMANNNGHTVILTGSFNGFLLSYLLGATCFNPLETRSLCSCCGKVETAYPNLQMYLNNAAPGDVEKCDKCGNLLINISQYSIFRNDGMVPTLKYYLPRIIDVYVSEDFFIDACDFAAQYFSLLFNLGKKESIKSGKRICMIGMSEQGEIKSCDTINDVKKINKQNLYDGYTVNIYQEDNLPISQQKIESNEFLAKLYSPSNIHSAACILKEQLPKNLQKDTEFVTTPKQLMNILIFLRESKIGGLGGLNVSDILEAKSLTRIDDWTSVPLTKEDFTVWNSQDRENNPESWKKPDGENDYFGVPEYVPKLGWICNNRFRGDYSGSLHKLLLETYFKSEGG